MVYMRYNSKHAEAANGTQCRPVSNTFAYVGVANEISVPLIGVMRCSHNGIFRCVFRNFRICRSPLVRRIDSFRQRPDTKWLLKSGNSYEFQTSISNCESRGSVDRVLVVSCQFRQSGPAFLTRSLTENPPNQCQMKVPDASSNSRSLKKRRIGAFGMDFSRFNSAFCHFAFLPDAVEFSKRLSRNE